MVSSCGSQLDVAFVFVGAQRDGGPEMPGSMSVMFADSKSEDTSRAQGDSEPPSTSTAIYSVVGLSNHFFIGTIKARFEHITDESSRSMGR